MDFEPNESQRAIVEAVDALLARHAGAGHAAELCVAGRYDTELHHELVESGFLEVGRGDTTALDAVLVTEAVARSAGIVSVGAEVLVAAALDVTTEGPVALARQGDTAPLRFGADARSLLISAGDEALVTEVDPAAATRVPANTFSLPLGRPAIDPDRTRSLGPGSGAKLRSSWRLALAAELLGCMEAALDLTVAYVKERRQFGRAIGSFQALQHRLAHCAVQVEATRWLAYEAAAKGAGPQATATAAAQADAAAHLVFRETHQLTGAMGFTREHGLHVYSMRIPILRLELGGLSEHRRAVTQECWGITPA